MYKSFLGQNINVVHEEEDDDRDFDLILVLVMNFPFQQVIWYTMIFGWLKAAETLRNPFGNPRQSAWNHRNEFCLGMYEELEVEIWKSAKFISNQDVNIPEE